MEITLELLKELTKSESMMWVVGGGQTVSEKRPATMVPGQRRMAGLKNGGSCETMHGVSVTKKNGSEICKPAFSGGASAPAAPA